jgi:Fur family ferric uptake transcriptional regulator
MEPAIELLRENGLKITLPRKQVLNHILHCAQGHTLNELADILNDNCDRVTVYRTLKTLEEKGLIHAVHDGGAARFKLNTACRHKEQHEHIHFKCDGCGEMLCIDEEPHIPVLPEGYLLSEVSLLLKGKCARCANSQITES